MESMLRGKTALVTGASSGIGRSVAQRLARAGAAVCLSGRSAERLAAVREELRPAGECVYAAACDLNREDDVRRLGATVAALWPRLDFLVHAAGTIALAPLEATPLDALDEHYRVNVRAPLLLTQLLLDRVRAAQGQIAFINSSLGVRIKERAGAYAASKHALRAIAETLRAELGPDGVRVITVFPGNTATPMQREVCRALDQPYVPERMLQPDDVAAALVNALTLPPGALVTELHVLPARPGFR
ncbi:MAG TPA: SDR family NAD(P)-dependent oxidoreductase [Burkholderiales bacterium]